MRYSFKRVNYLPPPPPTKKVFDFKIAIVFLIIGLIVGSSISFVLFTASQASLKKQLKEWKTKYGTVEAQLSALEDKYNQLKRDYDELEEAYSLLKEEYNLLYENYSELEKAYQELLASQEEEEQYVEAFLEQAKELFYYRLFSLYDYKHDEYWFVWYKIKAMDYYSYRFDVETHTPASLENRLTEEILIKASGTWADPESSVIREIAMDLMDISGGDAELFTNLALQLVHQIYYNITSYTKYPVETLVEGSGDCDNVAVLLASILRAAGLDTVILLVKVPGGAHAMAAVALPSPPDDLFSYNRKFYWYYEYDGKTYYLLEATWPEIGEKWIDPASPDALWYDGSMVGDNPWGEQLEIVSVVKVP